AAPSSVLVGTSPACALRLVDRLASRRHLSLEIAGGALRLVDLGSKNGTRVNGLRVADAYLAGGETVLIGDTTLAIEKTTKTSGVAASFEQRFGLALGASREMRRLYPLCAKLAASDVP